MSLGYTKPTESFGRKLRAAADDGKALLHALTKELNVDLPNGFPKHQLIEIARSVAQLPDGTAEGSRPTLEYAADRLHAIHNTYTPHDESSLGKGGGRVAPRALRQAMLEQRLSDLVGSSRSALKEYWQLSGTRRPAPQKTPRKAVASASKITANGIARSNRLEAELAEVEAAVRLALSPNSARAEKLKRQICDAQSLNRLARAELGMREIVVAWYQRIVDALNEYPPLIRKTATEMQGGADIPQVGAAHWHEFERLLSKFYLEEFQKTCDAYCEIAQLLQAEQHEPHKDESTPSPISSERLAPHLPALRRYAYLLTGSLPAGDSYVRASLTALFAGKLEFTPDTPPRLALFRLFHSVWSTADDLRDSPVVGTNSIGPEQRLRTLAPLDRAALLLTAVEGFSTAETGQILGLTVDQTEQASTRAQHGIERQLASRVLIIEDEPIIAEDLKQIAVGLGHQVVGIAATRADAVANAQNRKPGLVLADINLGEGGSGADAVSEILGRLDIPVIFITAYPERLPTPGRSEPTYLVTKPFLPETVQATINQALFFHTLGRAA